MREFAHEFADIRMQVPTELQKIGGIFMLRTGFNRAKPNYSVGPRMIDCYSFHFILEGSLRLTDEEREITLQTGRMFCLFPNISYSYRKADSSNLSMFWLAFAGKQSASIISELGLTPEHPFIPIAMGQRTRTLLKRIHESAGNGNEFFLQQSLIYELFGLLYSAKIGEPDAGQSGRADWLEYCANYMRLHYSEAIRIEWLANELGIHRSHFSNAFRLEYGMSPKQYLTRLRMSKAAELLRDTSLPVNEIALTIGYPELFAFTRAFVNYYGLPPSEYRKNGIY